MSSSKIITGLSHVEWREPDEGPPQEQNWERNQTCPRIGEIRWAMPRMSHRTPIGGRLRLLYEPWFALFNGPGMFPSELDKWAIVECEILAQHEPTWMLEEDKRFMAANPELQAAKEDLEAAGATFAQYPADEYKGWIQVRCHRVVQLWEIPHHFPITEHGEPPFNFQASGDYFDTEETDRLICHSASDGYGEAREWWVITKTTPRRLVLYCFEVGDAPFEIHNAVLPE
jgi:hypothetical protein